MLRSTRDVIAVDMNLHAHATPTEVLLLGADPLVWPQYVIAVLAPLGLLVSWLRLSVLHVLLALLASGCTISTALISLVTIPTYFVSLGPLTIFVLLFTLLSGRQPTRAQLSDATCPVGAGIGS